MIKSGKFVRCTDQLGKMYSHRGPQQLQKILSSNSDAKTAIKKFYKIYLNSISWFKVSTRKLYLYLRRNTKLVEINAPKSDDNTDHCN